MPGGGGRRRRKGGGVENAMDFRTLTTSCPLPTPAQNNQLSDLQITNLLGEGGFAKVFRGLWRGLTVGIKVRGGRCEVWGMQKTMRFSG